MSENRSQSLSNHHHPQIPAEAFPTRYRCTLYGISAASGKLGSVFGQVVVVKVQSNKRLGITLIL